jgi:IS30 family transposase
MANRQIARDLRVAPSTIDRQLARLGRHCLLYHTQQMQDCRSRLPQLSSTAS